MNATDAFGEQDLFAGQVFSGLTLAGPEPRNRRFEECRFVDCRFTASAFRVASFLQCQFEGCDLSGWDIEGLRFVEVQFKASKLVGFHWPTLKADPLTAVSFEDCVLDYSDFSRFQLKRSRMQRCSVREVSFERTDLSECDCRDSDFAGSTFDNANLTKADFRGARGYAIDARTNRVKGLRVSLPDALNVLTAMDIKVD